MHSLRDAIKVPQSIKPHDLWVRDHGQEGLLAEARKEYPAAPESNDSIA